MPDTSARPLRAAAHTILALAFALSAVVGNPASGQSQMTLNAGIHLIQAEVVNTFPTRAQGLMFRKSLGANHGMLFVFPDVERHCMWMKNTLIPLSVAFMDERGVIVSIHDMQPQTEDSHCAAGPARYALEMNQGWFAKRGVKPGAAISGVDKAPPPR